MALYSFLQKYFALVFFRMCIVDDTASIHDTSVFHLDPCPYCSDSGINFEDGCYCQHCIKGRELLEQDSLEIPLYTCVVDPSIPF